MIWFPDESHTENDPSLLSFKKGDIIHIEGKRDEEWYTGLLSNNTRGAFHLGNVRLLVGDAASITASANNNSSNSSNPGSTGGGSFLMRSSQDQAMKGAVANLQKQDGTYLSCFQF